MTSPRSSKGISLVSLTITIVVILIISGILIYNTGGAMQIKKLNNMYNDIKLLEDKAADFYAKYQELPIKTKYTTPINFSSEINPNDNDTYYIIDLSKLDNITLSYGKGQANGDPDTYIINEQSRTVYYVLGIKIDNKSYHRAPGIYNEVNVTKDTTSFITEWTITEGYTTINLSAVTGTNLQIDYGNGTNTYEVPGVYQIKITGTGINWDMSSLTGKEYLTKIVRWGEVTFNSVNFSGCINLKGNIPVPGADTFTGVTSFDDMFKDCINLTGGIPENLFESGVNAVSFESTFENCSNLTKNNNMVGSIPEGLFSNNTQAANFIRTFFGCSGLTGSIPENLFADIVLETDFSSVFENCTSLSGTVPMDFFGFVGTATYTNALKGCIGIEDVPIGWK